MRKWPVSIVAAATGIGLLAGPTLAQTATDVFVVSITIENACTIDVTDLSFGTASDLSSSIAASTSGTVTCTSTNPVAISFDPGSGGSSTFATRHMESGVETIDYNLYRDAAHTEILGDGSGGTFTIGVTSTGGADPFDVFGLTQGGQNPKPVGTYTSTITATVAF